MKIRWALILALLFSTQVFANSRTIRRYPQTYPRVEYYVKNSTDQDVTAVFDGSFETGGTVILLKNSDFRMSAIKTMNHSPEEQSADITVKYEDKTICDINVSIRLAHIGNEWVFSTITPNNLTPNNCSFTRGEGEGGGVSPSLFAQLFVNITGLK